MSSREANISLAIEYAPALHVAGSPPQMRGALLTLAQGIGVVVYPNFYEVTEYGTVTGLMSTNCRHFFDVYFPGITELPELPEKLSNGMTNEQFYEATQKQRYLERQVRKTKGDVDMLQRAAARGANNSETLAVARLKLGRQQGLLNAYVEKNGLIRSPWRERAFATMARPVTYKTGAQAGVTVMRTQPVALRSRAVVGKPNAPIKPPFVPARSIKEAQAFAITLFDDGYSKTFKGVANNAGISLEVANEVNAALYEIFGNSSMPRLSGIKAISPTSAQGKKVFKSGADAIAAYNAAEKGIFLNKAILKNMESFLRHAKEAEEAFAYVMKNISSLSGAQLRIATQYKIAGRALVNGNTIAGIIRHEVGHLFDWKVLGTQGNAIKARAGQYASRISGYASSSGGEYIAESYAAWLKGEKKLLDPELVKVFESSFRVSNVSGGKINQLVYWEIKTYNGVIVTSRQFGNKLKNHARDWHINPTVKKEREAFLGIITGILEHPDQIRRGSWRGILGHDFFIKGNAAILAKDGIFISILKGGLINNG
jgi:hypothetical protein